MRNVTNICMLTNSVRDSKDRLFSSSFFPKAERSRQAMRSQTLGSIHPFPRTCLSLDGLIISDPESGARGLSEANFPAADPDALPAG